jgi:hypothetical protein
LLASLAFALAAATALAPPDSVYANAETARLVALARARHAVQDTLVTDYEATVRTRLRFAVGRSRFGRTIPLFADEQVARIQWSRPNDVRLEFTGRRQRALTQGLRGEVSFDEPWFFPRGVGDSVRLISDEIPERAALHPLAADGEAFYKYALDDSLTLVVAGRTVRLAAIQVQPRRLAPALVAGHLWVDRETGEVTRFTFFFLGEYLFGTDELDSAATRRDSLKLARENRLAARALRIEADLEYGLYEQRYWMPYRQLVTLQVEDIWITGATLPVRFETTFADYKINRGEPVAFAIDLPDSVDRRQVGDTADKRGARAAAGRWSGGRWEVSRPPLDSLDAYQGWTDSLDLDGAAGDEQRFKDVRDELAAVAEDLPSRWVGRTGITAVKFGEFFRFNRIQGVSLGSAYAWEPGLPYLRLIGQARYGFKDGRFLWGLAARRDAPGGLLELEVSRRLVDVDPRSNGGSLGNSLSALFTGHDDADYMLATGSRLTYTRAAGRLSEWTVRVGIEEQQSVATRAGSVFDDWFGGDGILPPNPTVADGVYGVAGVKLDRAGSVTRWRLGADGLAGDGSSGARVWADLEQRTGPATVRLAAGAASQPDLRQLLLRAGGPRTVRGHLFGAQVGRAMWSAQVEIGVPRARGLVPFVFADAGAAGAPDRVFTDEPLLAAGFGIALHLLIAELRLEVARSLGATRSDGARVDLVFRRTR